jgi:hypothetical protein
VCLQCRPQRVLLLQLTLQRPMPSQRPRLTRPLLLGRMPRLVKLALRHACQQSALARDWLVLSRPVFEASSVLWKSNEVQELRESGNSRYRGEKRWIHVMHCISWIPVAMAVPDQRVAQQKTLGGHSHPLSPNRERWQMAAAVGGGEVGRDGPGTPPAHSASTVPGGRYTDPK